MKNICGAVIDWSATGDVLSGLGTILGAGAVLYAARKGADTFSSWRRQKREERRMDLAEQILVCAYEFRRTFSYIRSPALFPSDIEALDKQLTDLGLINGSTGDGKRQVLRTAQAALNRVEHEKSKFDGALALTPIGKAIFGDEVEQSLEVFWRVRSEIVAAAHSYAAVRLDDAQQQDFHTQLQNKLWDFGIDDDPRSVSNRLGTAISTLERVLLPIVRDGGVGNEVP